MHQAGELEMLIKGCRNNERASQNELYSMFYPKMSALVRRYFPEPDQADELINLCFLKVFKNIGQYSFKGSFEGWVRTVFKNTIINYAKKQQIYHRRFLFEEREAVATKVATDNLYYDDLLKMVQDLPDTYRTVFNLFAIDGFKHREIAQQLDISLGTSKWYLSEARKLLKEKIEATKLPAK